MTSPTSGSGRPRNRDIDDAVLDATSASLDEHGYRRLSIEDVARRAGTTRPAVYRRWSSRSDLALAALARRLEAPEPPDTGCTICDLGEGLMVFLGALRTVRPDVLGALFADCEPESARRDELSRTLLEPSRRAVLETLRRAVARGDLRADTDCGLLVDMLAALVYQRALFGRHHLATTEIEQAVAVLLGGVATDYPALVAHSRALEHADRDGG